MQLRLSLTVFMASVIAASLSPNTHVAEAAAVSKRSGGMITLPLKRVPVDDDLHPIIVSHLPNPPSMHYILRNGCSCRRTSSMLIVPRNDMPS